MVSGQDKYHTMQANNENPSQQQFDDFPMKETVEDFAGKMRTFIITCEQFPDGGYNLEAEEEGKNRLGYYFSAFSEVSPYSALGELRVKMRRALATRHLSKAHGHYRLLHDTLRGRIGMSFARGLFVVVDGIPLSWAELGDIMETYEGWQFRLEIVDPSDDVMG